MEVEKGWNGDYRVWSAGYREVNVRMVFTTQSKSLPFEQDEPLLTIVNVFRQDAKTVFNGSYLK
jgi:hypothetical protein